MRDFTYWNPTRIEFGRGKENNTGAYLAEFGVKKVLLAYGSERIKRDGLFDRVSASLADRGIEFVALGGIVSNPLLSRVKDGIALVRENDLDGVLAVGGGSVLDSCKAISAGAKYDGETWDLFTNKAAVADALPVFSVLTLAATGSEMNSGGVVTNDETREKFPVMSPLLYPKVSIVNPALMSTVGRDYLAYSAVDIIAHCVEYYFTAAHYPRFNLSFVETIVRTVVETTEILLEKPEDYDARAEFAWASTQALNGMTAVGAEGAGFPMHMIEHALSALYDIAHGAGLAIVIPAWMKWSVGEAAGRFERFGREIFGTETADEAIVALENWFRKIGAPVTLAEGDIPRDGIPALTDNAFGLAANWGMTAKYSKEAITEILELA